MSYTVHPSANEQADYVLFSSGLGGHGQFWSAQIAALQPYFHVVVYDQEGCHHDSALLPDHYQVEEMAIQVAAIIKALNIEQLHFIGHALGGHIGLALARLQKTAGFQLLSLGLINAWGNIDPHTQKCFAARTALLCHAGAEAYVRAQALFLYPPDYISKQHVHITAAEDLQLNDFPPVYNVLQRLKAVQSFSLNQAHLQALAQVNVNIFANTDDFLVPVAKSKELAAQIAHAQYYEFAYGGHASTITQSDVMNQALLASLMPHF